MLALGLVATATAKLAGEKVENNFSEEERSVIFEKLKEIKKNGNTEE